MPKEQRRTKKSTTAAAAGIANGNMPNVLILAPVQNRPLQMHPVMYGGQMQMVRIEQASNNNGPMITTGGGFVPSVSGVGPQYLIGEFESHTCQRLKGNDSKPLFKVTQR